MKDKILLVAAILGLLATSCKKEIENPQQGELLQSHITINASYKGDDSAKVDYTENGNTITATWETGDELYVVYDGHVSTLTLTHGAGTGSATFSGTISYTHVPTSASILSCYVKDVNNASALTIDGDNIVYSDAAFLNQDGTLASAAKCNTYFGMATYGTGENISCVFSLNSSMLKLFVCAPDGVTENASASLTYKSGSTELAKVSFSVGANCVNTIYMTVPAGVYSGTQTLVYKSGSTEKTNTLSTDHANFVTGQTYSKTLFFGLVNMDYLTFDYEMQDGDILIGTLPSAHKITIAANATVTLRNATITPPQQTNTTYAGLTCLGMATIVIEGTNNIKPCRINYPGIQAGPTGTTLTIRGSGILNATSNGGCGIGPGDDQDCGNIVIEEGTINAKGEDAGIGSNNSYSCGNITIKGGIVKATGSGTINGNGGGVGIGAGSASSQKASSCGDILIEGGTVEATGTAYSAAIGSSKSNGTKTSSCGNITINAGASVNATKGSSAMNSIGKGYDYSYSVCGTVTIGGTVYWDGSAYQNGGATYLPTSPLIYP